MENRGAQTPGRHGPSLYSVTPWFLPLFACSSENSHLFSSIILRHRFSANALACIGPPCSRTKDRPRRSSAVQRGKAFPGRESQKRNPSEQLSRGKVEVRRNGIPLCRLTPVCVIFNFISLVKLACSRIAFPSRRIVSDRFRSVLPIKLLLFFVSSFSLVFFLWRTRPLIGTLILKSGARYR